MTTIRFFYQKAGVDSGEYGKKGGEKGKSRVSLKIINID